MPLTPKIRTLAVLVAMAQALVVHAGEASVAMAGSQAPHGRAATGLTRIVTGSQRGTDIQIGRELARWVAKPAGVDLEVLQSAGSIENIRRLRAQKGIGLALVQSDVLQAWSDEAAAGSAEAQGLVRPLRVVLPLYDEELHFVVRADSPLQYLHEIRDMRINVGPIGSGSALSATTLYRAIFGSEMPQQNTSFLDDEEAPLRLATDRSIDVVAVVAGQPARLFAEMKPEARQFIKLLRLNERAPESQVALRTYIPATIRASSYPNWLVQDVPTLATKALLVTDNDRSGRTRQALKRIALWLCRRVDMLKTRGHAKWQEVDVDLPPLSRGWSYDVTTERELRTCVQATQARAEAAVAPAGLARSPAARQVRARNLPALAVTRGPWPH